VSPNSPASPRFFLANGRSELRILCYRYLVPNIDFVFNRSSPFDNTTSDLRSDGDSCTPAILRVSKQVYREAIKEFYGYRTFTLEILNLGGPMGFNFLSQECLWDKDLPSIFFSVKKLCLSLEFSSSPDLERSRQLARIVRHCFLERASCLESLHIQIEPGARFWLQHMRYLDKLPITIDCYLGPLMEVRGLSTVTVGKVEYKFMTERSLAIIETKDRMLRDLDAALDELKNLMVLPWPETALGPSLLQVSAILKIAGIL